MYQDDGQFDFFFLSERFERVAEQPSEIIILTCVRHSQREGNAY